jgi:hypothetical protein
VSAEEAMTRTHGYLTAAGVDTCLQFLARSYPSICHLIELPERSVAGRICHALRIAGASGPQRNGVLFVGGVQPPDVTPDLLVYFSLSVCQAYALRSGCAFGARLYDAPTVRRVVEGLDTFVLPLLNPQAHLLGQGSWRDARRREPGSANVRHLRDVYPNIRSTHWVEGQPRLLPSHLEALSFIDYVSAELLEHCVAGLSKERAAAVSIRPWRQTDRQG